MSTRSLFALLLAAGAAFWLYSRRAPTPSVPPAASATSYASGWSAAECVRLAEQANSEIHSAALLLARPPVDGDVWRTAEARAGAAISAAEACGAAAATETDRRVWNEVASALNGMRGLLSDLAGASRGAGSPDPSSQESIDRHLEAARAALKG